MGQVEEEHKERLQKYRLWNESVGNKYGCYDLPYAYHHCHGERVDTIVVHSKGQRAGQWSGYRSEGEGLYYYGAGGGTFGTKRTRIV